VKWGENRFFFFFPKTEHHEGKGERMIPLFPELRAELERHFSLDETKGNEFVIQRYQKTSWNLTSPLQTIARHAGLGTLIRPFDNMRMSRSNEVESRWGAKLESLWIGHSVQTMHKHYAMATEEDFAKATGMGWEGQTLHAHDHAEPTDSDGL
jgi:hypothetical protein